MKDETEIEEAPVEMTFAEYINFSRPDYITLGDYEEGELGNFLGNLNETRTVPKRVVFLSSTGGFLDFVHIIIDALETADCELVACNRIYSAAFLTFFASDIDRRILPDTIGMFHYPYRIGATLRPDNVAKLSDEALDKLELKLKIPYEEYFKELLGIDKKKHKELLKGGELIYDYKGLQKLLKKSKKLLAKYKK